MEKLFVCPICKHAVETKKLLRKHIKKHSMAIERRLAREREAQAMTAKKIQMEKRLSTYGSVFKNEAERNKYFDEQRRIKPLFDITTPSSGFNPIVSGGAFGLGKSRKH